jgi:hypothetical protein
VNDNEIELHLGEILGHVRGVPTLLNEHKGAIDTLRAEQQLITTRLNRVEQRQTEARQEHRTLEERVRALEVRPRVETRSARSDGARPEGLNDLTFAQRLYIAIPILLIIGTVSAIILATWVLS